MWFKRLPGIINYFLLDAIGGFGGAPHDYLEEAQGLVQKQRDYMILIVKTDHDAVETFFRSLNSQFGRLEP